MKNPGKIGLVWGGFLLLAGTLWAASYSFQYNYQVGGVIITEANTETYLKIKMGAHKGVLKDDYLRRERLKYEDRILAMKGKRITKVHRTYQRYRQELKPFQAEQIRTGKHPAEGLTFSIESKGGRDIVTLVNKNARLYKRSVEQITLGDEVSILARNLPSQKIRKGHTWALDRKSTREFIGDDFAKSARARVNLRFLRRAFHRGYRCAKIKVDMKVEGKHKIGAKVKLQAKGYFYYALGEGVPISMKLKGNFYMDHTETAPKGQQAFMKAVGPYNRKYIRDYRPPEIDEED